MKRIGCIVTLLVICCALKAQLPVEKGLQSINRKTAEAYIEFLASDNLEGREAGARGGEIAGQYIVSCLKMMGIEPFFDSTYYQPFEAHNRKKLKIDSIFIDSDSIIEIEKIVPVKLALKNVLGIIKGKNPDDYIIVGAHYDHLGIDSSLIGDSIYNGADDNASGVSAVLQIARAFVESGIQPERSIIFAFWDGEEKKLLGSNFFVETYPNLSQIKTYMNFDMIGRNTDESRPNHVDYFYTDTHPQYGDWLKEAIRTYNYALSPNYRPWDKPIAGSDNASFARKDIPIIWYHTDGHPDYHKPTDHADKLNWEKLVEITKTAYLVVWKLANEWF